MLACGRDPLKTPPRTTQRAAVERLWRRAEEIRSLCGLAPLTGGETGSPDDVHPASLEPLVELLLRDLESNFRRELATRVQLEGLGELVALAAREDEPGRPYRTLVAYLARTLDEPRLWLGVMAGNPPAFTIYRPGDAYGRPSRPEAIPLSRLDTEWLRWLALGEGSDEVWTGPSGSRVGGPWTPIPVRGEVALDRLSGEVPICPGAIAAGPRCPLSGRELEDMAGGHRACGRCQFRRISALIGVVGRGDPGRSRLEPIASSLGPILGNLALRESLDFEGRFRGAVIQNLPLGVVAVDKRERVLAWNRSAEAITGLAAEIARAEPIPRLLPSRTWHDALMRSLHEGETAVGVEHEIVRTDGTTIPTEVSTAPILDGEGNIRGAVATLHDVSSLKRMEDRIRQLDRLAALGRFASSVAHELRNPLTGIATGVQYLSRGFPEGDERHESVAFILREVVRLNTIIQDLFNATKPKNLLPRPTKLQDVVEWAVRGLHPTLEASGITIEREGADDWPTILADADLLQQVLLNLIQNAAQASHEGAVVTVRAHRRTGPEAVVIEVEDRGHGILPEQLPHVFEPFFTTRPKGTGLGLFVAHGIVQRHGGTLEVESEPGQGTKFRVVLPET